MHITRRYLAIAGAFALSATSLLGQAELAYETAIRKAIETLARP